MREMNNMFFNITKVILILSLLRINTSLENEDYEKRYENFFSVLKGLLPDEFHPLAESKIFIFWHMMRSNMASWKPAYVKSFKHESLYEIIPKIHDQLSLLKTSTSIKEALTYIFGTLEETIRVFPLTKIAKKWAPKLILAQNERYFPSSVDFFLDNVNGYYQFPANNISNITKYVKGPFKVHNLPTQQNIEIPHGIVRNETLNVRKYLEVLNTSTLSDFIFGQQLTDATSYALIEERGRIIRITYWFFYPYNKGKYGLGNHIGDWEHVSLKLVNLKPKSLKFSVHDTDTTFSKGGKFIWNGTHFSHGKHGGYTLSMMDTHPLIYVASGSHGHWFRPGKYLFKSVLQFIKLYDICSHGEEWKTWKNMKVVLHRRSDENYLGEFSFLNFQGHWGNYGLGNCNVCPLKHGPIGPLKLDPFIYS